MQIAADIFHALGMPSKMTIDPEGRLDIVIDVPSINKPGETVIPRVRLFEVDNRLIVRIDDNGDGRSPLSRKLKDIVEQALAHQNCATWRLKEQSFDAYGAKAP